MRNRNLKLQYRPTVEAMTYDQEVLLTSQGRTPSTHWTTTQRLDIWTTASLIRDLRCALRKIRDETTERLNKAVVEAESPLP